MGLEKLSLEMLASIDDGRLAVAFDQALQRCYEDLNDRPGVKKPRSLKLSVVMTPVLNQEGHMSSVDVGFDLSDHLPKRQSQNYNMAATRAGLIYNELAPEDVNQMTLDMTKPREVVAGEGEQQEEEAQANVNAG